MARKPPARPSMDIGRRQAAPAIVPGDNRLAGAREVLATQLVPDPDQPRRTFPADTLAGLAESITQRGVLQALLVRTAGVGDDGLTRYAIIDGERRWRAARLADRDRLPVLVRDEDDSETVRVLQLIANVQREDLDPIEEAVSFRDIMQNQSLSTRAVGALIGRNHMHVQRRLDLLFDERLEGAVREGRLNASTAVEVKSLPAQARDDVLSRLAAGEDFDVASVRRIKSQARRPVPSTPMNTTPLPGDAPPVTIRYSEEGSDDTDIVGYDSVSGVPITRGTRALLDRAHRIMEGGLPVSVAKAPPGSVAKHVEAFREQWRAVLRDALREMTPEERTALRRGIDADVRFIRTVFDRYRD